MAQYTAINLYSRCSDDDQVEGLTFERQFGNMRRHLIREGLTDIEAFFITDEGHSGYHGHHRSIGKFGLYAQE